MPDTPESSPSAAIVGDHASSPVASAQLAPAQLWTRADATRADRFTMDALGIASPVLMERAAWEATRVLMAQAPTQVDVLCGPGNNGGDGLALARQLAHLGVVVRAWRVCGRGGASVEQQSAWAAAMGVELFDGVALLDGVDASKPGHWVVDAMLGTGSEGAPRGAIAAQLERLRSALANGGSRVLALDLPTGVDADTGAVVDSAVRADITVTFERSKPGLHTAQGRRHAGEVWVAPVGLRRDPEPGTDGGPHELALLDGRRWLATLRSFDGARHKGERGHLTCVGGSAGTSGALVLTAEAGLRAGAGLVSFASAAAASMSEALDRRPELMQLPLDREAIARTGNALVVGPGWTDSAERASLSALWASDPRPACWDAGGLELVSPRFDGEVPGRVLTPHPKEAAALLARIDAAASDSEGNWSVARVQGDRIEAARRLAHLTRSVVVLKGEGSIVSDGERVRICNAGDASLATAGSGDVLAGTIGARLAAGASPWAAACVGVHVHALAGERLGRGPGPVAGDVALEIGRILTLAAVGELDAFGRWPAFTMAATTEPR